MSVGIAAAKFWADFLRQVPKHDNGDLFQSNFTTVMSSRLPLLDSEKVDAFESILAESIQALWYERRWTTIGVDYHPDTILSKAAEEAGLGDLFMRLPFKTLMWLEPQENKVYVSVGYGAKREELKI